MAGEILLENEDPPGKNGHEAEQSPDVQWIRCALPPTTHFLPSGLPVCSALCCRQQQYLPNNEAPMKAPWPHEVCNPFMDLQHRATEGAVARCRRRRDERQSKGEGRSSIDLAAGLARSPQKARQGPDGDCNLDFNSGMFPSFQSGACSQQIAVRQHEQPAEWIFLHCANLLDWSRRFKHRRCLSCEWIQQLCQ